MTPRRLSMNPPSSIKTRFAYRFLRALKRLKKLAVPTSSSSPSSSSSSSSSSPKVIFRRYCSVKMASDASMAYAVGSRRAWSRAMLRKMRCQAHRRRRRKRRRRSSWVGFRKKRLTGKLSTAGKEIVGFGKFGELRKLVPGGKAMDLDNLLDETAHYIKCLATQVQVMANIVDFCSTTTSA